MVHVSALATCYQRSRLFVTLFSLTRVADKLVVGGLTNSFHVILYEFIKNNRVR